MASGDQIVIESPGRTTNSWNSKNESYLLSGKSSSGATVPVLPIFLPSTNDQENIEFLGSEMATPKPSLESAHFQNMRSQLRETTMKSINSPNYFKTELKAHAQKWFDIHERSTNIFEDSERLCTL